MAKTKTKAAPETGELWVRLGNEAAIERPHGLAAGTGDEVGHIGRGPSEFSVLDGSRVTYVTFPEGTTLIEAFTTISAPAGLWAQHSTQPPAWVASNSPELEKLLAGQYGCTIGEPDDVEETHHTDAGPPGVGPDGPIGKKVKR